MPHVDVRRVVSSVRSLRSLLDHLVAAAQPRRTAADHLVAPDWDSDGVSCTMCARRCRGDIGRDVPVLRERLAMSQTIESRPIAPAAPAAPYSRALQLAAGVCLVLAAVTNGLSQYVGELFTGDGDFSDQIRWGAEHVAFHRTEQILLVVSALFMPL